MDGRRGEPIWVMSYQGPDRITLMKSRQLVNPAWCCRGMEGGKEGKKRTSRLMQRRMRHHPRKGGKEGRRVEKDEEGGQWRQDKW